MRSLTLTTAIGLLSLLTGTAEAGTKTITIGLDGMCDSFAVTLQDRLYAAAVETDADGRCETFLGEGRIANTHDLGRVSDIGGNFNADASAVFTLDVQVPLVTGGAWHMYKTADGVHMVSVGGGTYTVLGPAAVAERPGPAIGRRYRN